MPSLHDGRDCKYSGRVRRHGDHITAVEKAVESHCEVFSDIVLTASLDQGRVMTMHSVAAAYTDGAVGSGLFRNISV